MWLSLAIPRKHTRYWVSKVLLGSKLSLLPREVPIPRKRKGTYELLFNGANPLTRSGFRKNSLPSREITYPTLGKLKSSSNIIGWGMLVPWGYQIDCTNSLSDGGDLVLRPCRASTQKKWKILQNSPRVGLVSEWLNVFFHHQCENSFYVQPLNIAKTYL